MLIEGYVWHLAKEASGTSFVINFIAHSTVLDCATNKVHFIERNLCYFIVSKDSNDKCASSCFWDQVFYNLLTGFRLL